MLRKMCLLSLPCASAAGFSSLIAWAAEDTIADYAALSAGSRGGYARMSPISFVRMSHAQRMQE
jgi:hypothetical protein